MSMLIGLTRKHAPSSLTIVLTAVVVVLMVSLPRQTMATNAIDVDVVIAGQTGPTDSLIAGIDYDFRIWFENDFHLGSFNLGFKFWSDDGAVFNLQPQANGYGASQLVGVIPYTRMWDETNPNNTVWDLDLLVDEGHVDGSPYDSLKFAGVALADGMPVGSLEPMITLRVRIDGSSGGKTLCIDTCDTSQPLFKRR